MDGRLEDRARARGRDDTLLRDLVVPGNRLDQVVCVVGRVSTAHPRRHGIADGVDRLLAGTPRVLVGTDPDHAAIVRPLQGGGAEGHRLVPAANDEGGGEAAESEGPHEVATGS